jgi:NAD(P)-dependent dehydrogenase (short-subunit alcohol dehydrogenase family)
MSQPPPDPYVARLPRPPFPEQAQERPGDSARMTPPPEDEMRDYLGRELLAGKVALVTGGDSGIGRAVTVAFAKEGADVAVAYLAERNDAEHTRDLVERAGRRCVLIEADLGAESHCTAAVERTVAALGHLDVLVNNHAVHEPCEDITELATDQWLATFEVNVHGYFWVTRSAVPHLPPGSSIINTASVNGLRGNPALVDYSATKGAVIALTYALAQQLAKRGIRVNAVAPGPVWTPLIPASFPAEKVSTFGADTVLGRPAQPDEIAPSYVFLAAPRLSSYYTGEVLAPVGGETMPG